MKCLVIALILTTSVFCSATEALAIGELVQVTLKDGNVFQGVLTVEAEAFIVLRIEAYEITLQRESIAELRLLETATGSPGVEPLRAMWSSLIIPGFGQFLNGDVTKGFVHLAIAIGLFLNLANRYQQCTGQSSSGYSCDRLDSLVPALVPYMAWSFYSASDAYTASERHYRSP